MAVLPRYNRRCLMSSQSNLEDERCANSAPYKESIIQTIFLLKTKYKRNLKNKNSQTNANVNSENAQDRLKKITEKSKKTEHGHEETQTRREQNQTTGMHFVRMTDV